MKQGDRVKGVVLYQKTLARGGTYVEIISSLGLYIKCLAQINKKMLKTQGDIVGRNIVACHTSRMYQDLAFFSIESLDEDNVYHLFDAPEPLLVWKSALDVCRVLHGSDNLEEVYAALLRLKNHIWEFKQGDFWRASYIALELVVLSSLGFGLSLNRCAVTQKKDKLSYISPKTGASVTYDVGKPFADKLFEYPAIFDKMARESVCSASKEDFFNALDITGFFLRRYVRRSLVREQIKIWK